MSEMTANMLLYAYVHHHAHIQRKRESAQNTEANFVYVQLDDMYAYTLFLLEKWKAIFHRVDRACAKVPLFGVLCLFFVDEQPQIVKTKNKVCCGKYSAHFKGCIPCIKHCNRQKTKNARQIKV
jgi:hypothetical protein